MQLQVPCQLVARLCNLRIPVISDLVCQGGFAYCLATQVHCREMLLACQIGCIAGVS